MNKVLVLTKTTSWVWRGMCRYTYFSALIALGLNASSSPALAQFVTVSAQHTIVTVVSDLDGRKWLTLGISLTNHSDQDLSDVRLLTAPGLSPTPGDQSYALEVGYLPVDAIVTMEWTFESIYAPNEGEALPGPVMFLGEATDDYGDFVSFLVDSIGGE